MTGRGRRVGASPSSTPSLAPPSSRASLVPKSRWVLSSTPPPRSVPAPYAHSKVTCERLAWLVVAKSGPQTSLDRTRRDVKRRGLLVCFVTGARQQGPCRDVRAVRPGLIRDSMDTMPDDFVQRVEPLSMDHRKAGASPAQLGDTLSHRSSEVADAMLSITDDRVPEAKNATLEGADEGCAHRPRSTSKTPCGAWGLRCHRASAAERLNHRTGAFMRRLSTSRWGRDRTLRLEHAAPRLFASSLTLPVQPGTLPLPFLSGGST